jgi:Tfp pilus assembly protein PilX
MMRRSIRRVCRDDSGASLVFVLLIVTVIAMMIGAVMSFADTSTRATVAARAEAGSAYNADGALQAAINNIRNSTYPVSGQHCFGGSDTLSVPYGSGSAAVSCAPDQAQVTIQCVSLSVCNRPGSAILTLGTTAGEDGINVQQNTGSTFRVHGTIFSNSNIDVVNGTLNTNTAVYAKTGCSGAIQSNPAPSCTGNVGNPLGADPNYAPQTVPATLQYQKLPTCTAPNSVVTFAPGYYDDAVGLSAMMAGNSACKHSVWYFAPGSYYFDFHNSGLNANSALPGGSNIWTVNDGYLIAGNRTSTAYPPSIPGACDNPIYDAHAQGAQFIFGNDSQFVVSGQGQAEICGTYNVSAPPVALYGLKSGTAATTTLTGQQTTAVAAGGSFANASTTTLANIENTYAANTFATWTTPAGKNKTITGSVTVTGYAPATAIPAGSNLLSATLHVGHRYKPQGNDNETAPTVAITPNGGSALAPVTVPTDAKTYPTGQVDNIDVTGSLAQTVHDKGFSGASMVYSVTEGAGDTEDLDGIQLDLTYLAPAYRAEGGCITAGPYTGTGSGKCALVNTPNSSAAPFYVQGTTYAPNAVLDLALNNSTQQIFRFGVIARSLWVHPTGSFSYTGPVIGVPDDQPGFVFSVFLNVYVCPTSPTCGTTGSPVLQSRVGYVDANPVNPQPGARQVTVLSWSSPR